MKVRRLGVNTRKLVSRDSRSSSRAADPQNASFLLCYRCLFSLQCAMRTPFRQPQYLLPTSFSSLPNFPFCPFLHHSFSSLPPFSLLPLPLSLSLHENTKTPSPNRAPQVPQPSEERTQEALGHWMRRNQGR